MITPELRDRVEALVSDLGEHFEAVQILATHSEGEGCSLIAEGCGNWYARQGMAHDFIARDQAQTTAYEIAIATEDDHD